MSLAAEEHGWTSHSFVPVESWAVKKVHSAKPRARDCCQPASQAPSPSEHLFAIWESGVHGNLSCTCCSGSAAVIPTWPGRRSGVWSYLPGQGSLLLTCCRSSHCVAPGIPVAQAEAFQRKKVKWQLSSHGLHIHLFICSRLLLVMRTNRTCVP